eukprot:CAMPEP_0181320306 /NCGR_PEP_ID=MMETSP1101-20121128/18051_1 /TAXON_ID=46948 /ORGANISM="Rhodomonas abbreviata, Strain Caron Lab Isolate" /LENGTH=430 /DNA_ID=CAMNT_0023427997 /DNA_START=228 /DNA_END=1520 /DNA_ORIENTATION=+
MHIPNPVSVHSPSNAGESCQESHRSRSCQGPEAFPRPRPACLFRASNGGGGGMFNHLLRKPEKPASAEDSSAAFLTKGNESPAARCGDKVSTPVTPAGKNSTPPQEKASSILSSPQHHALFQKSSKCSSAQLLSSFEVLRSDVTPQQKVQAANTLANLTLRAELLPCFQESEFLNNLVGSMKETVDECVKRFVYMTLVRLVGHKDMVRRCVQHPDIVGTAVSAASQPSGSSWRQAARALAIMAGKSRTPEAVTKLTEAGVLRPISRLLDLDQTEFKTDAICAFSSWATSPNPENVHILTDNGVWPLLLEAMSTSPAQAVHQVGTSLLVEACKATGSTSTPTIHHNSPATPHSCPLELDLPSFSLLCDLCWSSDLSKPMDVVLCRVMLTCSERRLPHYARGGGARRLLHLVLSEGGGSQDALVALARVRGV